MHITIDLPYDEHLLRRTLRHLLRRSVLIYRILGLSVALVGALLALADGTRELGIVYIAAGFLVAVLSGPLLLRWVIRRQSPALTAAVRMTFTDEHFSASGPLFEARYHWAIFSSITDTPEAWLLMVGKFQAITVPKAAMTADQRQTFAAFLARRPGGHPAALAEPA
ncbi:YcxB family protein [Nocardia sp. NPDC057227]|uniref:YcxB family protein n=1 Tax=Nocardia sp. NPDC057227 TaxID=3346056 RepID=UPI003641524E